MKNQIQVLQKNLVGSVAGGAVLFFLAKKSGGGYSTPILIGVAVVGVLIGANIQAAFKAQKGASASASMVK